MCTDKEFAYTNARLGDELLRRSQGTTPDGALGPSLRNGCGCDSGSQDRKRTWGLEGYPLAMVYSPIQAFQGLYALEDGFDRGTVFEELDLPFLAYNSKGGECCGK